MAMMEREKPIEKEEKDKEEVKLLSREKVESKSYNEK